VPLLIVDSLIPKGFPALQSICIRFSAKRPQVQPFPNGNLSFGPGDIRKHRQDFDFGRPPNKSAFNEFLCDSDSVFERQKPVL
jgi:hypothetical protein